MQPVWESSIKLSVAARATLEVPIVVTEPSVFNFNYSTDAKMTITFTDATSGQTLHRAEFRRLMGGHETSSGAVYRCRGSFELGAAIVNLSLGNSDVAAGVHGSVRIEPLRQIRPQDDYRRRAALRAAIATRQEQQRRREREVCATRTSRPIRRYHQPSEKVLVRFRHFRERHTPTSPPHR